MVSRRHATQQLKPGGALLLRAGRRLSVSMPRIAMCVLLSVALAFAPLEVKLGEGARAGLDFQRSEAHAFAPIVAGGAAALAAELGISIEALYAAILATAAAGTGLGIALSKSDIAANNWPTDKALPGFRPWDDLSAGEKDTWGDLNSGTIGEEAGNQQYWQKQFDLWALLNGWTVNDGNGGSEPTPEPDKNEDPEGHKRWQKARNVLALLGTGATVGLAEVVGAIGNNFIDSLFKPTTDDNTTSGFGLTYSMSAILNETELNIAVSSGIHHKTNNVDVNIGMNDWAVYNTGQGSNNGVNTTTEVWMTSTTEPIVISKQSKGYRIDSIGLNNYILRYGNNGATLKLGNSTLSYKFVTGMNDDKNKYYLNPYYSGTYRINGTDYSDGELASIASANYGQIQDTPNYITNYMPDYSQVINNVNNQVLPEGEALGVSLPDSFTGADGTPSWLDYVKNVPSSDVEPVPDDVPVDVPGDNPNPPNPGPGGDFDYPDSIGEAVENLGKNSFGRLFPFCLINDMQQLSDKVSAAAGYSGRRGLYTMSDKKANDSKSGITDGYYVLPLTDFGIAGVDDMTFDFRDLFRLGNLVRPWFTVLFAFSLIAESIRYFLK